MIAPPCPARASQNVIVFDLDDTLYLERDYVRSGLRAVGRWATSQLGTSGLADAMVARFERGQRTRIFDESLADFGIVASATLITRMVDVYRQHPPDISLAPDAESFLGDPPPSTAFAIITDGFLDSQRRKLRALDVYHRGIRFGVCTDRWGRADWKPSERSFVHVQTLFELDPARFCYVADNPAKDFKAPVKLGWKTVRIARPDRLHAAMPEDAVDADRVIETLSGL